MRLPLQVECDLIFGRKSSASRLAAVRFGPVQCGFLLNLKPDHRSGSYKSLNIEPDRRVCAERVQRVRFRVQQFLDPEPDFLLQ
jgi:hypothetical protein